ncbi:MAG: two-component system sensor histidine kinase HydH [Myxococcota bacterium]|jgi:two-component system sensor histidine kinase HydH
MEHWYRIQAALLAAIICAALAVNVILRTRRNVVYARFAALSLNLVAWYLVDALAIGEALTASMAAGLRGVVGGLLPGTLVSFFAAFVADDDAPARWSTVIARLVSFLLIMSTVALWSARNLFESDATYWQSIDVVEILTAGAIAGAVITSVALMYRRYRSVEVEAERGRLLYLTVASAAVLSLALIGYTFEVGVAFFGNILVPIFMFFLFQVVTLRRILDLFEFLGRFVVLASFAVVLSAIYAMLVAWWRHDLGLFLFNTTIATIVILILLDPLRSFVEERLNELIFRDKFEFVRQVDAIRASLANVIDVGAMAELMLSRLETSKQVTHAGLYLRDEEGLVFNRLGFVGSAPPDAIDAIVARPFLARVLEQKVVAMEHLLTERDELIESGSVQAQTQSEVIDTLTATMVELETVLTVALESDGQLLGFLNIKDERLRVGYGTDEIKAIIALAAQATLTIENSRLFDTIRERDRLAAIGQMAAGLAHEIRNPLGAIKGAAQLVTEVDAEQRAVFLGIITDEVDRLDGVVSQFLTYARPLKGLHDMIDVNQVIERTLTLVRADDHESQVEFVPAPNIAPIRSDPELLRQVILNLSRNAIEAMAPQGGGKLLLTTALTWRSPNKDARFREMDQLAFVRIRVEDEGPGIPPEVMERLFIPFYTTKANGTGLGLAICQRIIKSLGGSIEISSRAGRGTTFGLFLPVHEPSTRTTTV